MRMLLQSTQIKLFIGLQNSLYLTVSLANSDFIKFSVFLKKILELNISAHRNH